MFALLFSLALWLPSTLAIYSEYFPPPVEGVTVLPSKQNKDITLSYKQTDICDTSYSGYVHLPASSLTDVEGGPDYDMNVFYWYFPARESPETAPIAIWLGGGPGEPAIEGAVTENGPCYVNPDGNGTTKNPFSRNNQVNMLYVDQPVGTGYSYSSLVNVTYNQITTEVVPTDFSNGISFTPNLTVFPGTVSNPDLVLTANNSNIAARGMWHFAQTWFDTFPYLPENQNISLWTNSYGGFWGPAVFRYWESQNKKIQAGQLNARPLQLDTLGIENGCIDAISQLRSWVDIPYNNTYNFQMINQTVHDQLLTNVTTCYGLIQTCRDLAQEGDPDFWANNQTVNDACTIAAVTCFPLLSIATEHADVNAFDFSQKEVQIFPPYQDVNFFNKRWVQQGLGVPVNYTKTANLTTLYFVQTADPFRQNQSSIEYLLDNDVQVAFVYGDRDTRCNWIGAENVSLTVDYSDSNSFREAGYADIQANASYVGGVVRQYDGFSFSRVFEAGHEVSSYQPETHAAIFNRVMFRKDVATGGVDAGFNQTGISSSTLKSGRFMRSMAEKQQKRETQHYSSQGPASSWSIKNVLPPSPEINCNVWAASATCTEDQLAAIMNGTAETTDFIVTSPSS